MTTIYRYEESGNGGTWEAVYGNDTEAQVAAGYYDGRPIRGTHSEVLAMVTADVRLAAAQDSEEWDVDGIAEELTRNIERANEEASE